MDTSLSREHGALSAGFSYAYQLPEDVNPFTALRINMIGTYSTGEG
jgi:hypothetical protein